MSVERIEQLRAMLAEEPGDLFIRYAIALEQKRAGNMEQAVEDLRSLLHDDPTYVAAYYQFAMVLADLGHLQEAVDACEAGSLQCIVTGDRKARAELLELKRTLSGEGE
jgi:tetratricopeptide (TPR) repeat protein